MNIIHSHHSLSHATLNRNYPSTSSSSVNLMSIGTLPPISFSCLGGKDFCREQIAKTHYKKEAGIYWSDITFSACSSSFSNLSHSKTCLNSHTHTQKKAYRIFFLVSFRATFTAVFSLLRLNHPNACLKDRDR